MKSLLVYIYLGILTALPALAQPWTIQQISHQRPLLFKILALPVGDKQYYLMPGFDTLSPTPLLAKLAKQHPLYLSYLTSNYSHVDVDKLCRSDLSPEQANDAYHQALEKDTLFNQWFVEVAVNYLQAQGVVVKTYAPAVKSVVTMPALMQITVRFFNRLEAQANDHVAWYINLRNRADYDKTVVGNQPLIEAFCHETIMKWSSSPGWRSLRYDHEFYEAVRTLTIQAAAVTNAEEQLQVVRPAMRHLMMNSKALEQVLLTAYQLNKDWLGFKLVR